MKKDEFQKKQEYINWLDQSDINVFATLKFKNGYDIPDAQAKRVLRIFLNKADRTYFGKSLRKQGVRLKRFVFLHRGHSGTNTHYHVAFESFGGVGTFCQTMRSLWLSFDETCPTSQITEIKDKLAVSVYCFHEYSTLKQGTFIPEYSHSKAPTVQRASMNQRQYMARLTKANYSQQAVP